VVRCRCGAASAVLGLRKSRRVRTAVSRTVSKPQGAVWSRSNLRALCARIAFTHPDIAWSKAARAFFETAQLIREYRADRVFDALRDLLAKSKSDALRRDALTFAFRQFPSLNNAQRAALSGVGFFVPRADGAWAPAAATLLSPAWGADGAACLLRCLAAGGEAVAELVAQKSLWIADPQSWPTPVTDLATYRAFLNGVGVRDGLLLTVLSPGAERQGNSLFPALMAKQFGLTEEVATGWVADVAARWAAVNTRTRDTRSRGRRWRCRELGSRPLSTRRRSRSSPSSSCTG